MRGCECCIYYKIMHSSLLSWRERVSKTVKDQFCNKKNRRFSEIANNLFETYKNSVMPHEKHMFQTTYDMEMEKMCA